MKRQVPKFVISLKHILNKIYIHFVCHRDVQKVQKIKMSDSIKSRYNFSHIHGSSIINTEEHIF